jgi:hypothetical protein
MVSIDCRRNYFFCWLISAGIFILATGSLAANNTSTEGAKKLSVEERTLTFPGSASFGALALIPHDVARVGGPTNIGAAVGTVKVSVPNGQWLTLELNPLAFMHPKLLDSCSAVGLDGLVVNFIAMDDSEGGWCDTAMQHANHFKNLKCLILNKSDVSDVGVSALRGQHDIECIRCVLTRIHGDCFKTFSQFKNLYHLDCGDCTIKEENLKYLSDCHSLTYVDLRGTRLGNLGVKYLSKCSNLTGLRIGCNAAIDDASIKYLLDLRHLDVDRTSITFSGLKALAPMHLRRLTISGGTCPAKDLPILKKLAKTVEVLPQSRSAGQFEQLFQPLH